MADQYNPVLSNTDAQIDCDNDASSSSNIIKFTHDSGTELMRIQEDGNVGIGTTNPSNKLTVLGNQDITGNLGIGTPSPSNKLTIVGSGNEELYIVNSGGSGNYLYMGSVNGLGITGYGRIGFFHGGDATFGNLVIGDGAATKVGIGTTNPSNKLTVLGNQDITGNLGIGTTSPVSHFELQTQDENAELTITAKSNTLYSPGIRFRTGTTPSDSFIIGVDNSGTDTFKISASGSFGTNDRLVIDANGLVGIGTIPGATGELLTIGIGNTTASNRKVIRLNSGGFGEPGAYNIPSDGDKIILYHNTENFYDGRIGIGGGRNLWIKSCGETANSGEIEFYTGSTGNTANLRLKIDGVGRVGIGTTIPVNILDVRGYAAIGNNYAGIYTAPSNGLLVEGNVGIGQTSANEKLEINGNIKATGTVAAGNDGLYWKVYTHTLTSEETSLCNISHSLTASKVRGIVVSIYRSSLTSCYSLGATGTINFYAVMDNSDITVNFGSSFTTGDVVNVIVYYVP